MMSGMKSGYLLGYLRCVGDIDHYLAEFHEERDAHVF